MSVDAGSDSGRRTASELTGGLGSFAGLDSSGEDEDANENAGGGESQDEDGPAERLADDRGRAGGGVFTEAAALGVSECWHDKSHGQQEDSRLEKEQQVLRLRLALKRQTSLRMTAL
jgi:hypothetical protein